MGNYVNRPVTSIQSDPVIFFSGKEISKQTPQGTLHFLFGLGYYSSQFQINEKNYIFDNRPLTGLILSDFVYDELSASKPIALNDDLDVILNEMAFKVPIDLSNKTEQKNTFIKGILIRNIFTPFKDVIVEMLEKIRGSTIYQIEATGHKLLCTEWDHFNMILTTTKIKTKEYPNYLDDIPGIAQVTFWAEDLLNSFFSEEELQEVDSNISLLQQIYAKIKYDPIELYSILKSAVEGLKAEDQSVINPNVSHRTGKKTLKRPLLLSAESRIDQVTPWPEEIIREPLEKVITGSGHGEEGSPLNQPDMKELVRNLHTEMTSLEDVDPSELTVSKVDSQRETFEFSKLQKNTVEEKSLPPDPEEELEVIFRYLEDVINQNYDMKSIGNAFEIARAKVQNMNRQSKYIWSLSKYMNKYILKNQGIGLSEKEKEFVLNDVDSWLNEVLEEKRKEKERLEQERLEAERIAAEKAEQERLEAERIAAEKAEQERLEAEQIAAEKAEQERLEAERIAAEKAEQERLETERSAAEKIEQEKFEQERIEQERLEKERLEKERLEQDRIRQEQEKARLEQERLEKDRLDKERAEQIQREKAALLNQKQALKQQAKERKEREKAEKKHQKELQKIEKEKKKLEKIKAKEEAKAKKKK
jgi:hypothetical protein